MDPLQILEYRWLSQTPKCFIDEVFVSLTQNRVSGNVGSSFANGEYLAGITKESTSQSVRKGAGSFDSPTSIIVHVGNQPL